MNAIPLLERTLDVDGHEFAPPHLWGGIFGPVAERLAEVCAPMIRAMGADYIDRPGQAADDAAMTHENVWTLRHTGSERCRPDRGVVCWSAGRPEDHSTGSGCWGVSRARGWAGRGARVIGWGTGRGLIGSSWRCDWLRRAGGTGAPSKAR